MTEGGVQNCESETSGGVMLEIKMVVVVVDDEGVGCREGGVEVP